MPIKVGVTGGIGSGKSVASEVFKELGWFVVDFDRVVWELFQKREVLEGLSSILGFSVVDEEGRFKRREVSETLFNYPEKKKKVEEFLHPLVVERALFLSQGREKVVFDAPLLIESGFWRDVDKVVLIVAPFHLRLERASRKLGITKEEVLRRMASQMTDKEKKKYAHYVIENTGTIEELKEKVRRVEKEIIKEVKGHEHKPK